MFLPSQVPGNPSLSHADRAFNATREPFNALNKNKYGIDSQNMQAFQDLSKMLLERSENNDTKHWEEDTTSKPKVSSVHFTIAQVKPMVPSWNETHNNSAVSVSPSRHTIVIRCHISRTVLRLEEPQPTSIGSIEGNSSHRKQLLTSS